MKGYEYLVDYLRNVDVEYHENENIIWFKHKGRDIFVNKYDDPTCRIFCNCKTEGYSQHELMERCNMRNLYYAFVKYAVVDNDVWCVYEFIPTDDTTSSQYMGYLNAVIQAFDKFLED